jgi:SAM-dependent methyltransferase
MPDKPHTSAINISKFSSIEDGDSDFKVSHTLSLIQKHKLNLDKLLDVGCGKGRTTFLLSRNLNIPADGIDISEVAIQHARENYISAGIRFLNISVEQYHFHASLGVVFNVIENVDDYIGFLKQCHGKADLWIFNIPLKMTAIGVIRSSQLLNREFWGQLHYFSKKTAEATLAYCGYEIIESILVPTSSYWVKKHPSIRNFLVALPKLLLFFLNKSFCTKLIGGATLFVLARSRCELI